MNNVSRSISTYYEGGIGDVLLGHKLAWVLKSTIYPDFEYTAFCDTENNPLQARVLKYLFGGFYKEIFTIPRKKYKELWIDSQFGSEKICGFYDNVPTEWQEKIQSYSKFYNFHIDSLLYLDYPELQWADFHKRFPLPEVEEKPNYLGKTILSNLISTTGTEHSCEKWWSDRLIKEIDDLAIKHNFRHIIISTDKVNDKYKEVLTKCQKSNIINAEVEEICDLVNNCELLIGIDSAWRLISHFFNKNTITISKNCHSRGNCPISHILRWLQFPETTFPIHAPTTDIIKLADKMISNQIFKVFPELAYTDQDISNLLIRRNYKINLEKSILNENP